MQRRNALALALSVGLLTTGAVVAAPVPIPLSILGF
jgi:hypothetical protein